jgi:hypothetical protein
MVKCWIRGDRKHARYINRAVVRQHGSRYAAAIEAVLERDREIAKKRSSNPNTKDAVFEYLNAMDRIDLRSCPPEFQQAYLRHKDAWSEMYLFHEKYDGTAGGATAFLEGLIRLGT